MRTPAGVECPYFFGDYFRGRNHEECRLIKKQPPPHHWTADLCQTCPVPAIVRANACPNMQLKAQVSRGFLFIKRQVKVSAFCSKTQQNVAEPAIGCGQCHPIPEEFER